MSLEVIEVISERPDPYRESDKWHNQDILRLAWETGYEQGVQDGFDERYGTGLYDERGAPF
jgi:hypothetical protein